MLEKLVCSFEKAQHLKALGVVQKSAFKWEELINDGGVLNGLKRVVVYYNAYPETSEIIQSTQSAFTVGELGAIIKKGSKTEGRFADYIAANSIGRVFDVNVMAGYIIDQIIGDDLSVDEVNDLLCSYFDEAFERITEQVNILP